MGEPELVLDDAALEAFLTESSTKATCQVAHYHDSQCATDCPRPTTCGSRARYVLQYKCAGCGTPHFILVCDDHHDWWAKGGIPEGAHDAVWREL